MMQQDFVIILPQKYKFYICDALFDVPSVY